MIFKVVTFSTAFAIGMLYVTGFIFDSAFLEKFGISYAQILGSPLDYLAIGGIYALNKFSYWGVLIVFFLLFLFAFGIGVLQKYKDDPAIFTSVKRYVNSKSAPYLIASSSLVFLMSWIFLVITDSQNYALEVFEESKKNYALEAFDESKKNYDEICITGKDECIAGIILRYRGGKVFFYNHATEKSSIYNDSLLAKAIHSVKKPVKD